MTVVAPTSLILAILDLPMLREPSLGGVLLAEGAQDPAGPFGALFMPMVLVLLLFYFMILRPQQTKQRKYQELLDNLKENDQVVTNGGLYGVVTGVHRDAQRVTLRVDDATGAKVRVALWAISHLASEEKSLGERDGSPAKTDAKSKK